MSKAWDYYNQPKHIIGWNFADPSWFCPSVTSDLRVGGKHSARMEAKDGSVGFDFEGTYLKINEGKSVSLQLDDARIVDVYFRENGDKTDVEVTFDAETQTPEEIQRGGWQAILDSFKKYSEAN